MCVVLIYVIGLRFLRQCALSCFQLLLTWVVGSAAFLLPSNNLFAQGADGILVPGGFGDRGVEGKILAVKYARENNVPFLGICLGMQIAVIEFARSVMNLEDANSTEFDPDTTNPCVVFMPEVIRMAISFVISFMEIFCFLTYLRTINKGLQNSPGRYDATWIKEDLF